MSHVSFFRTSQYFPDDSGFSRNDILEFSQQQRRKSHFNVTQTEQDELFDQESFQLDKMRQKSTIKMNLLFVVQYRNNQKLSSNNWFFNGFCKEFSNCQFQGDFQVSSEASDVKPKKVRMSEVSPKYTILLDVGLRPEGTALCKMYNTMINHPKIGGVCGYMGLKTKKNGNESQNDLSQKVDFVSNFFMNFVDIQRAQQVQQHFGHLIDKSFESVFKFVQVLPEAFSGYNMNAIWGSSNQLKQRNSEKLLNSYFKSIDNKLKDKTYKKNKLSLKMIFAKILLPDAIIKTFSNDASKASYEDLMHESNVQDRILSMVVYQNNFDLIFLPDAYSFIDSVKDIPSLMAQRKRWINGSYFAFEKFSEQFAEMGCCRILSIQIWYLALMNMLAFIAPGLYMFSINLVMDVVKADVLTMLFSDNLVEDHTFYGVFIYTMNFLNSLLMLGLIYFSINLNSENQKFVKYVYKVSTVLGTVSVAILVILVVDLVRGFSQSSSYLISNQSTPSVESLPGGQGTIDFMRYLLLAIMGMYAIPLVIYSLLFSNIRTIFQVLLGVVSFVFYYLTYLIVLNIYALCRMDHLSWGTEGIGTSGSDKKEQIQSNWKIVKIIHAGKMIFWNVIVAGILVHWGSNYLVRFYLIFSLMIIIAFSMAFKAILAIFYYMYYKININSNPPLKKKENVIPKIQPSLYKYFKSNSGNPSTLETHLRNRVKDNVCHLLIQNKSSYDRRKSFQILQILNQSAEKMNKMRCFAENSNESGRFEVRQRAQKRDQIPNLSDRELEINISKKNRIELTPIKINNRVDISCEKLLIQQMDEQFNEPSSQNHLMPSENALKKEKILSKITLESVQPDQQEQNQHQDKKEVDRKLNYKNETDGRNKSVKKIKQKEVSSNSYKRSNTDRKRLIKPKILRVQSPFKDVQSEQFGQLKQSSDNGRNNTKKRNKSQNPLTKPPSKEVNLNLNHAVDLMRKKLRTLQIDDFTN